ncbi:putative Cystatin domain-containing protein [Rosa chinensis]|uniref:Putative Cystatin domain-containing protein n=1 Tax=Rosa chinensis TaxID=74649 RepID=A0A2P6PL85_ROSCH|nr:putative Cystatin domain-containing protein [Rosa chinensis]
MGLVPVLGKLRNNLIAVNRRSIADNVIKASNNLNSGHQEHKPWLHPDPCIRSLLRKFSLPTCKELWTDWTPNKQFTYGQLWTQLLSPLVTFDPPESTHRRLMDDDPQITATAAFAVAEFNKQKNAQLRFIRAVKGFRSCFDYFLTMEAVDAHAVRTYQALVKEKRMHPYEPFKVHEPFKVLLFGLVADNGNGNLLNLIDNRRNGLYGECLYDDRGN